MIKKPKPVWLSRSTFFIFYDSFYDSVKDYFFPFFQTNVVRGSKSTSAAIPLPSC